MSELDELRDENRALAQACDEQARKIHEQMAELDTLRQAFAARGRMVVDLQAIIQRGLGVLAGDRALSTPDEET